MGSSSGYASPYSSLVPTTRNRGDIRSARMLSRRFTWEMMLVLSVWAARCTT
jgi:hypothetical protein